MCLPLLVAAQLEGVSVGEGKRQTRGEANLSVLLSDIMSGASAGGKALKKVKIKVG